MYVILFPPSFKGNKVSDCLSIRSWCKMFWNSFCDLLEQKEVGDSDPGIPFLSGLVQDETNANLLHSDKPQIFPFLLWIFF